MGKTLFGSDEERLKRLKRVLQTQPDNEERLAVYIEQLPDYIAAQRRGENCAAQFPELSEALDAMPELAAAYARLYDLEVAEAEQKALTAEKPLAAPNLSFLTANKTPLRQQLKEALQIAGEQIQLQFNERLLTLLAPPPAMAAVRSAPVDAERYDQHIVSISPEALTDLVMHLTIDIYRDTNNPEDCLVEITVEPKGKSWPELEGSEVTISYGDQSQTAETDAWGNVSFTDVAYSRLDSLKLSVKPAA